MQRKIQGAATTGVTSFFQVLAVEEGPRKRKQTITMTIDTRERIIKECNKMIMSVGPSSMTMDDVARACGISKRTLYEAFPDKRTLISEMTFLDHCMNGSSLML